MRTRLPTITTTPAAAAAAAAAAAYVAASSTKLQYETANSKSTSAVKHYRELKKIAGPHFTAF